jgi:hypothetical protein
MIRVLAVYLLAVAAIAVAAALVSLWCLAALPLATLGAVAGMRRTAPRPRPSARVIEEERW